MENKKSILKQLLDKIQQHEPLIIVGIKELGDKVSLHSQELGIGCDARFWESVKHLGFGYFEGETPNGKFTFEAGGAMHSYNFEDKSWLSYSKLCVDNDKVLKDLNYPFEEVSRILTDLINSL